MQEFGILKRFDFIVLILVILLNVYDVQCQGFKSLREVITRILNIPFSSAKFKCIYKEIIIFKFLSFEIVWFWELLKRLNEN